MDRMILNEVSGDNLLEGCDYLLLHEGDGDVKEEIILALWDGRMWQFEDAPPYEFSWADRIFEGPASFRIKS